jgi:Lipocalin-like domain
MVKEQFMGSWKLISSSMRSETGEMSYPSGRNQIGQIMYDGKGNMSAQIMKIDRPKFASDDPSKGTREEILAAFDGSASYFGTYDVDEKDGTVTHHVKGSLFPNFIGQALVRYYQFSGNRLILHPPSQIVEGKKFTAEIIWEKIG